MADFSIRRADISDSEAIHRLATGLAEAIGDPVDRLSVEAVRAEMLAAGAGSPAAGRDNGLVVFVAEVGREAVGYVCLQPSFETSHASRGFYLSGLFVVEDWRRRGIGRALVAQAAAHARASGREHLWWVMASTNNGADRFYRSIANVRQPVTAFALTEDAFNDLAHEGERDGETTPKGGSAPPFAEE